MTALPKHCFTQEEFLDFESRSNTRHEFYQGEIFDMTGGSPRHALIASNFMFALRGQLKGGPCLVYGSDMLLQVVATGLLTYPDLMVACGDAALTDGDNTCLESPTVVVEVLSPSTEKYDLATKFKHYLQIDSLRDLLFIRQDQPNVAHHHRSDSGDWTKRVYENVNAVVKLPSIGCELLLRDVYQDVTIG